MASSVKSTVRDLSRKKSFQQILTSYSKDKKDTTQEEKDTTQDKKDIIETKETKQGHSGQRRHLGHFRSFFLFSSLGRGLTRGATIR